MIKYSYKKCYLLLLLVSSISFLLLAIVFMPFRKTTSELYEANVDVVRNIQSDEYANPVINKNIPDPSLIKAKDGFYYVFSTGPANIPIHRSVNLVDWFFVGNAFNSSSKPRFLPQGSLWAPDIELLNNKYYLYYTLSKWGNDSTGGIGVAIAESPEGKFVDQGKLFTSSGIGVKNSIDPFFINENSRNYLIWGGFHGLYLTELASNSKSISKMRTKVQLAGDKFEASYVFKRNGYYYFFASIGSCCEGMNSTYKLVVTRSSSLFGPYQDKNGKDMINNGYTLILQGNNRFVGPGHCSNIITDKNGKTWILYHSYDRKSPKSGRVLMLDEVKWDEDGWPYINNGFPSSLSKRPTF